MVARESTESLIRATDRPTSTGSSIDEVWMVVVATMENGSVPAMNFSALAFGGGTPKKAILTALIVGTVLTSINHGDLILAGEMPPLWKVLLTFCVPYCVTTWGAITGKRAQLFQMR